MAILIENIKDELSIRLFNVLKGRGIKMLEELVLVSPEDIHKWRNAGRKTSNELDKVMRRYNLELGQYEDITSEDGQWDILQAYTAFGPEFRKCKIDYYSRDSHGAAGRLVDSGPPGWNIRIGVNDDTGIIFWDIKDKDETVLYDTYDNKEFRSFEEADLDFCKFYMQMKELSKPRKRDRILDPLLEILEEEKPKRKSRRPTMWESLGSGRKRSRGSHVKVTEKDLLVQAAEFGDVPGIPHELAISKLVQKGQLKASASEPGAYVITAAGRKMLPEGNPRRRKKKAKKKVARRKRNPLDWMGFDPAPIEEGSAYVGEPDYEQRIKKQGRAYIGQLERTFGKPPGGVSFKLKSFPHEHGTYHLVVVEFDPSNKEESEYAFRVEGALPEHWDAEARKALGIRDNPRKKKAKKKAASPAKTLISKCQKVWKHYCERPGRKRLKEVFAHLEKMEKSSAKTVKTEMRRCRRSAKAEAKRLEMKV